jgi:hypothetical protein
VTSNIALVIEETPKKAAQCNADDLNPVGSKTKRARLRNALSIDNLSSSLSRHQMLSAVVVSLPFRK